MDLLPLLGAGGLAATFVFGPYVWIGLGRLVPRSTMQDVRADRDERLREMRAQLDDWRAAYLSEQERGRLLAGQIDELLELAHTTTALISSLPRPRDPA